MAVLKPATRSNKDRYAMEDDKIVTLRQPGDFADPLTEVLRNGARQLLAQAVEA